MRWDVSIQLQITFFLLPLLKGPITYLLELYYLLYSTYLLDQLTRHTGWRVSRQGYIGMTWQPICNKSTSFLLPLSQPPFTFFTIQTEKKSIHAPRRFLQGVLTNFWGFIVSVFFLWRRGKLLYFKWWVLLLHTQLKLHFFAWINCSRLNQQSLVSDVVSENFVDLT